MTTRRIVTIIALGGTLTFAACDNNASNSSGPASARTPAPAKTPTPTPAAADNSASNAGESETGAKATPLDQSNEQAHLDITANIRKALMEDEALSTNAKNAKIITDINGVVTLRGVVSSEAEKNAVQAKAMTVAGITRIDNQLEITNTPPTP